MEKSNQIETRKTFAVLRTGVSNQVVISPVSGLPRVYFLDPAFYYAYNLHYLPFDTYTISSHDK